VCDRREHVAALRCPDQPRARLVRPPLPPLPRPPDCSRLELLVAGPSAPPVLQLDGPAAATTRAAGREPPSCGRRADPLLAPASPSHPSGCGGAFVAPSILGQFGQPTKTLRTVARVAQRQAVSTRPVDPAIKVTS